MQATSKEKLLEFAKEKKLLRPSDFAEVKGARVLISRLVESGELVKIGRGLYSLPSSDFNEQQSLLEAVRLVPKGVICLLSALRFHDFTTQNPFEVWGDGLDLKDFLYIDDFTEGMLLAFAKSDHFMPINIASGIPVTIRDVLEVILKSSGHDEAEVRFDSTKPTMIPKRIIDISKMRQLTSWSPETNLTDGIARTIEWYVKFFQDKTPESLAS